MTVYARKKSVERDDATQPKKRRESPKDFLSQLQP